MMIDTLDHKGVLTVKFSEAMREIKDFKSIDSSVIKFSIETPDLIYLDMRSHDWYLATFNEMNCTFQFNW